MTTEQSNTQTAMAVAFPFYTAMMEEAERCRRLGHEADSPDVARRWFEAAGAAYRAATIQAPSSQPISVAGNCPYCRKPYAHCQGHIICLDAGSSS